MLFRSSGSNAPKRLKINDLTTRDPEVISSPVGFVPRNAPASRACSALSLSASRFTLGCALKFLAHPLLEGGRVLRAAEKILHQIVGRHRPTRLQYQPPVAHGSIASEQVVLVKLLEEILGYD